MSTPSVPMRMGCEDGSYEEAVAYLTEHPDEIDEAWKHPLLAKGGSLFCYASPDGHIGDNAGCLTQIRDGHVAGDSKPREASLLPAFTKEIGEDERLPTDGMNIDVEHLPVFMEWQKRLDEAYQGLVVEDLQGD